MRTILTALLALTFLIGQGSADHAAAGWKTRVALYAGIRLGARNIARRQIASAVTRKAAYQIERSVGARLAGGSRPARDWISKINPSGSRTNCVNCSLAVDKTLATGKFHYAPHSGAKAPEALENIYKRAFGSKMSLEQVRQEIQAAGSGARGIVQATRKTNYNHVFNVFNQNGKVKFVDGQIGREPHISPTYNGYKLLRTD